jgi:hypothetical protein
MLRRNPWNVEDTGQKRENTGQRTAVFEKSMEKTCKLRARNAPAQLSR